MKQYMYNKTKELFRFVVYILLPLVGGCGVGVSCSDMLETGSDLVEYEKDNTLNHATDSVYSVLGILNKMQLIADRSVLLGEVRGDLMTTTVAASADLKRLSAFDFAAPNKYNNVSDYYAVINNCNYYIAHADTAMQRRGRRLFIQEYAVVKTYRAWTYLQLVTAYGRVPLVTEPLMTEKEARDAVNGEYTDITGVCNFLIDDLTPLVGVELPNFGTINNFNSQLFFIPMRALLGDLCLWAGRYEEAAKWYHEYLTWQDDPHPMNSSRSTWPSATEMTYPSSNYTVRNTSEVLSFIPMEERVFDGVVSDLPNIFNSTREKNYYYQLEPSKGMRNLSAAQIYCFENRTDVSRDTLYAPKIGLMEELLAGDLRLYSNYKLNSSAGKDEFSEDNPYRQTISKIWTDRVPTSRLTMIYLRYAEALNRLGLPQSAMVVLKYGVCQDYIQEYVDTIEQAKAGDLITFDRQVFRQAQAMGIHSRGCGDTNANAYYVLPQPASELATRQDTVNYQIPLVEDMIIDEMALEGAFEGYRYYDLLRVALRRGDPAYLANPVSRRNGEVDEPLRALLMDTKNWFLPLP